MQKRIRLIIDIGMTLLMTYSLIGEMFHEIVGTLIFILFIIHHVLNRKWAASLFKGKYSASRVFRTVVNVLLFAFMILFMMLGWIAVRLLDAADRNFKKKRRNQK